MNLILKATHRIPIYEMDVFLYVAHDAVKTFNCVADAWGLEKEPAFDALATSDGQGAFGLFFHKELLTERNISHEVKHCADSIMDYVGQKHCHSCPNEARAFMTGYLQKWVKGRLKRAGLRVK